MPSGSITVSEYRTIIGSKPSQRTKARAHEEEDLHVLCVEYATLMVSMHPVLEWMLHVPNGGLRHKAEAGKLKAMGTKSGFPDLFLPRQHGEWAGLAIELKSSKGRVRNDQQSWLSMLQEGGYLVAVCRSLDAFIEHLQTYLSGKRSSDFRCDIVRCTL